MALATGECGLRFPAQHRRLAPCRSIFRPLLVAFLKPLAMQVVADSSVPLVTSFQPVSPVPGRDG